jgi:phospholipid/cholesterol/gamma-HCH transport system permease protein
LRGERLLTSTENGEHLQLAGVGAWTASNAGTLEPLIGAETRPRRRRRRIRTVTIDMGGVEKLDTFGAWLLEHLLRTWKDRGCATEVRGLNERYNGLLEEVRQTNRAVPAEPHGHGNSVIDTLRMIGVSVVEINRDIVGVADMFGAVVVALARVALRPHTFRLTSTVYHLTRVCWNAVPIILLITFLIGCILAQQGIFHFRKFGADIFVVDMIGILVLREIGVLIVSIMVAGRSGSAYTAELGAMKMREEIDALRTMGFDPVEVLILPRVVALLVAGPSLTSLGSLAALYRGGLVAWLYGGIGPDVFLDRLRETISLDTFQVGMIKAPFMALVIGLVACVEGMQVKGSSESLGRQTTSSVVKSIFLVIVLDGLFAMFFASIGK